MGRVFHIIDSIKGGCGKTTFAIALTEYLERKYAERKQGDNLEEWEHACLLDMDFVGTGMIDLFFQEEGKKEYLKKYKYLTDKIRNFQMEDKYYIGKIPISDQALYIGFGDPDFKIKEQFRCSSKYNYATVISYGIFRSGIRGILKAGGLEDQIKGKVSSIVLDMSPGLDPYSEAVKENIFGKRHSDFMEKSDRRNYYFMVGMDQSHLSSAKEYCREFLSGEDKKEADHIFIVFNDVLQYFSGRNISAKTENESKAQYNSRIDGFNEALASVVQDEKTKKKIHYLVLNPFADYAKALHNLEPLEKSLKKSKDFFGTVPFRYTALKGKPKTENSKDETYEAQEYKTDDKELLKWLL